MVSFRFLKTFGIETTFDRNCVLWNGLCIPFVAGVNGMTRSLTYLINSSEVSYKSLRDGRGIWSMCVVKSPKTSDNKFCWSWAICKY